MTKFYVTKFEISKKTSKTSPRLIFFNSGPKSAKKTVKLSVFFALSGSVRAKAAHRLLMKLAPKIQYLTGLIHTKKIKDQDSS